MKAAYRRALKNQLESELYANKFCKINLGQLTQKVSKNLSIIKIRNQLKIQFTQQFLSRHYRNRFLMYLSLYGLIFCMLLSAGILTLPVSDFILTIVLGIIPISSYIIYLCSRYLYHKKQIRDLSLNKVDHTIKFLKSFSLRKKSLKFTFNDFKLLTVQKSHMYPDDPVYKLSVVLKNNKKITIYTGKREICTRIGWNIARYSRKYCQYN